MCGRPSGRGTDTSPAGESQTSISAPTSAQERATVPTSTDLTLFAGMTHVCSGLLCPRQNTIAPSDAVTVA
jgi:hypothetical protein